MENLTVVGSGTMGHTITLNAAWKGVPVKMYGINDNEIAKGLKGIDGCLGVMLKQGIIDKEEPALIKARIAVTDSLSEAVSGASVAIEAIPEQADLKKSMFKQLDRICADHVILASNTSGLHPDEISADMDHGERFLILHFWNPAHLVPLVEVARCTKTEETIERRALELLKKMDKKPVVIRKPIPGFVGNRLQFALLREAQYLLENGIASKEDIDAAVTYGIGRRLTVTGPLISADMGGLDIFSSISDYLFKDLSDEKSASPSIRKLVQQNKLGLKSGCGYYDWDEPFSNKMREERESELMRLLRRDNPEEC